MSNEQLKVVILIEAGVIAVLLFALVLVGPLTSGSSNAMSRDIRLDYHLTDNEVRVIEKELFVMNMSGSESFVVDESWDAVGIYVEGITSSDAGYRLTYPGFPEGASTVNGTSFPFDETALDHIDSSDARGSTTAIYDEPRGNWTLDYIVKGGAVKISIVKVAYGTSAP